MSFHVQLKVVNKTTIPNQQLEYQVENKTVDNIIKDKLDANGCTKIHPCGQYDLVYFWIFISGKKYKYFRVYPQTENKYIQRMILDITTGKPSVGGSVKPVPVLNNGKRKLTINEIKLAKSIFKDSIDYSKVYIHDSGWFPFGLQSNSTAVTPNGEIYFNKVDYLTDFVLPNPKDITWVNDAHWFIHEMVHVWQFQLGFSVKTQGVIDTKNKIMTLGSHSPYDFDLTGKNDLNEFIMEAQADLVADYCMYINGLYKGLSGGWSTRVKDEIKFFGNKRYHQVLNRFLKNPKDVTLLPIQRDVIEDSNSKNYLHQYFTYM